MKFYAPPTATVAVAPTSTVVLEADVRNNDWATVQIENLDGSQTFSGTVERRQSTDLGWSPSTIGDFASIAPGQSVTADLDLTGTAYLRIVGTMSGAGGNVVVASRQGVR